MDTCANYTDDMNIHISSDKTNEDLCNYLMSELEAKTAYEEMLKSIVKNYSTSESDADLAIDRVQGGIVRALSGNPKNEPNSTKDPLAWISFNIVWQTLSRKHLFSKYKKPSGKWQQWYKSNAS